MWTNITFPARQVSEQSINLFFGIYCQSLNLFTLTFKKLPHDERYCLYNTVLAQGRMVPKKKLDV